MDAEKIRKIEEQILSNLKKVKEQEIAGAKLPWVPPEGYINERVEIVGKDRQGSLVKVYYDHLIPTKKGALTVIFFHGGGYKVQLLNAFRDQAALLSKIAGDAEVYSLDYRIGKYPEALDDSIIFYNHLLKKGYDTNKLIFAGNSAGAHLEITLCIYLRDNKISLPKKVITFSPSIDSLFDLPSIKYNYEKDVVLGSRDGKKISSLDIPYYIGADLKNDPYASPIIGNYKGFSDLYISTGSHELFLDDAKMLAEKAKKEGVKVEINIYEYMSHDFQMIAPDIEESQKAWEDVKKFILGN